MQLLWKAVIGMIMGVLIDVDHFIVGMARDLERIIAGAKTLNLVHFYSLQH